MGVRAPVENAEQKNLPGRVKPWHNKSTGAARYEREDEMATTMNMNPADDDFGFVTPEVCQAVFGHLAYDAAEVAAVQAWINRAGVIIAQGDGSAEDVRCTVEELADTHSEKAAAFVMERPELLAAAIKRGRKILRDRNTFALYRAHKLVAAGRTLESLTPQVRAALLEDMRRAAQEAL